MQVTHQVAELGKFGQQQGALLTGKFDEQDGLGLADQRCFNDGPEGRVGARQVDHRAVHQFHCGGAELDNVLRGVHGRSKGREVHHAEQLGLGQRAQAQRQGFGEGECAFRPHQQVRQLDLAISAVRPLTSSVKDVEVVAAHAAQDTGPLGVDITAVQIGKATHKSSDVRSAAGQFTHPPKALHAAI